MAIESPAAADDGAAEAVEAKRSRRTRLHMMMGFV